MKKPFAEKEAFEILLAARKGNQSPFMSEKEKNRVEAPTLVLERAGFSSSYASSILTRLEEKELIRKIYWARGFGQGRGISYVEILREDFPEEFLQPKISRRRKTTITSKSQEGEQSESKEPKESTTGDKVMMLIDYRNLIEGLNSVKRDFPKEELKELSRKYGIALTPRVYISHTVSLETAMRLGRMGYLIMFCPPEKLDGPDTVDERIHGDCMLFASHPQVGTFILISRDRDFRKTEDLLKDHHKKVIRFGIDESTATLKSPDGQTIYLPELGIAEEPITEKNEFVEVVIRMIRKETKSIDKNQVWFIRLVVNECKRLYDQGEMHPPRAKSFNQLKNTIWIFIHTQVRKHFSKRDCHQALAALVEYSNVLEKHSQKVIPRTYYLFNPNHTLPL